MKYNKIIGIAINDYDDAELNKIENCENDVRAIIATLVRKYIFEDVEFIFEKKDTTRKELFNKLNSYFINTNEDENVLLIFAGHGEYNSMLETAYWLPSDADPNDQSSWININEILAFIRVSKAFHISVISDSCFSGAIFEPNKRGGGIEAFSTKKSRLGLSSGSLEKVSDGKKGSLSPFAEILIKELEENTADEFPFSILANNLLMQFASQRNQTPMFGSLNGVGHGGGSFIFKLKADEKAPDEIKDMSAFLEKRMYNLYIPFSETDISIIREILPINVQKHDAVKKQKYEEAARLRDEEKKLEEKIFSKCDEYIDSLISNIKLTDEDLKRTSKIETDTVLYNEQMSKRKEKIKTHIEELEKKIIEEKGIITPKDKNYITNIAEIMSGPYYIDDPSMEEFSIQKKEFMSDYQESVLKVYERMIRLKSTLKSEYLENKLKELKEILSKIYKHEINLLYKGFSESITMIIDLKEIDIELLKWIEK